MSGGGIGQLCNIISLDQKHEKVVIHAGNNEVARTESIPEFVYTIEKAAEKLQNLSETTEVTFVLPCAPPFGPHEIGKSQYLEERIRDS